MIVAFLQNAWSPMYAGGTWPRESWLKALHRSRSGQRLSILTKAAGAEIWFDNTTPIVGAEPSSIVPPDSQHIQNVLWNRPESEFPNFYPEAIIAFGKQAASAVSPHVYAVPFLIVPHPAYRCLTNELYEQAGRMLAEGFEGRVELSQGRGKVLKT